MIIVLTKIEKQFYQVFLLFMLSVTSTGLYAIDKDLHPVVTGFAVKEYNKCMLVIHGDEISPYDAEQLALYSRLEDVTPKWDRLSNWHFHDRFHGCDKSLTKRYGFLNTSMHDIYKRRVESLDVVYEGDEALGAEARVQVTGRVLHYIQDVGVPAHVAVIYHSKPEGWFQELFVDDEPAAFDGLFTSENINELNDSGLDEAECRVLYAKSKKPSTTLQTILDDLAKETRKSVSHTVAVPENHYWYGKTWEMLFWPIRKGTDADIEFLHEKYGNNGFLKFHDDKFSLDKMALDADAYAASVGFFKEQYIRIRNNTVLALMKINLR